ncbi:MAG: hypothetical protein AAB116_03830 [Candidatus Poribacteria bacterium]
MRTTEERVDTLEDVLREFIIHTDSALIRFEDSKIDTDRALTRLERGLEDFKEEMNDFKDEMNAFKSRMEESHKEMKESHREMNRQWAALAKKMGTLDEDLVSPAVRPVISKYFGCDPTKRAIRELRRIGADTFEVDVLATCDDKAFMIEVRATPKIDYVGEILDKVPLFKKYYPEHEDKKVIPIFASIVFPEHIIQYATRKGLYVMAYREWEYMDIINFDEVSKKL